MSIWSLDSDPLEGSVREVINVQTVGGVHRLSCWRRGALAIHPRVLQGGVAVTQWSITHVPSGICFSWVFPGMDAAAQAMARVADVTDWVTFEMSKVTPQFRKDIAAAFSPFGEPNSPDEPGHEERLKISHKSFRRDLNDREGEQ